VPVEDSADGGAADRDDEHQHEREGNDEETLGDSHRNGRTGGSRHDTAVVVSGRPAGARCGPRGGIGGDGNHGEIFSRGCDIERLGDRICGIHRWATGGW
jgi:hypothetical protein